MICEAPAATESIETFRGGRPPWRGALKAAENAVVSLALLAMVVIPLAESVLRRLFHTGIPASTSIVQHMVLVVGMLGGAIAGREGRLLSLSTLGETSLKGPLKCASRFFTSSVSATVSGFLCLAALQFVQTERDAGKILAFGIPVWVIECVLPIGFLAIAIRILLHTAPNWGARAAATACAILASAIVVHSQGSLRNFVPVFWGFYFLLPCLARRLSWRWAARR